MFAAAAREVVFSNPEVIRRVNNEFIPVALKAALVNNPPRGTEGRLYAEIERSKPAPQGICTANSAGKVLTWALSFDDQKSILSFLDHVKARYGQFPDAAKPVTAQRFLKFPSHPLVEIGDAQGPLQIPDRHRKGEHCPGTQAPARGTLLGRIIGRALDQHGRPVADTIRQEHYMEARFELPLGLQVQLSEAVKQAKGDRFRVPDEFSRSIISHAFLGQLDVNPSGRVPGSQNEQFRWEWWAQRISKKANTICIRLEGTSLVAGHQRLALIAQGDGRQWDNRVRLRWQGYVEFLEGRIWRLALLAEGQQRLRWENSRLEMLQESDAEHLMAGHPIDLHCGVRFGLLAERSSSRQTVTNDDGSGSLEASCVLPQQSR